MTPEALAALQARAYTHMEPWNARDFAELLARPTTLLCEVPQAFCLGQVVVDEAEILALAADPAHQRQGHASAVLTQFLHAAVRLGVTRVFLDVAETNAPARGFYAAHGFAVTGRRRGYYRQDAGPATDALLMSRAVTQG